MSDLFQQRSRYSEGLGHEINRIWEAIRALQPVSSQSIKHSRGTRGTVFELNAGLVSRIGSANEIRQFTVSSTTPTTITATTGETITKPEGIKSESLTRLDPGDTANWHPRHGAATSISYHYHTTHYRTAIIHASGDIDLGGPTVDYFRQIQKLEPFYQAADTIHAVDLDGTWVDLNTNGRHWRHVFPFRAQEPSRNSTGGVDYFDPSYLFIFGTQQESDQLYSDDNPAWKSVTNFSAFDIY